MGKLTKIPWCDHTYNPWRGCRKVAPECENCYITDTAPLRTIGQKHGSQRVRAGDATLKEPLRWNRVAQCNCGAAGTGGRECGFCAGGCIRPRVFCLSLGDWLDDENVPIGWLADLLRMIHDTPNLDWLLLTKRPQNWRERIDDAAATIAMEGYEAEEEIVSGWLNGEPPANIWIGVSAGADQAAALAIPAPIHFLSCEPMLKPMDTTHAAKFDWIIFGGESGKNARPCDIQWIRGGLTFCRINGVKAFVKQLGSLSIWTNPEARSEYDEGAGRNEFTDKKGGDPEEWPGEDLRVREFPTPPANE